MSKYLFISRFKPSASSHGGSRRTLQLYRVFEALDLVCYDSETSKLETPIISKQIIITLLLRNLFKEFTCREFKMWHKDFRNYLFSLRRISDKWAQSVGGDIKAVLVEDPVYFTPLVKKMIKRKIPVIAFPQNLNSLIEDQVEPRYQLPLFDREIDLLSRCNLVVTSSKEDNLLFKNFGINTFYFPYYPPEEINGHLLEIRENRKVSEKKDFVLLGTVFNTLTKDGMIRVIEAWKELKLERSADRLLVAGFGTDSLKKYIVSDAGIELLGQLTDEKLKEVLSSIKSCLCYVEKGTAVLGRIIEMLIAGVPVIANTVAARSYYNVKGVIEFSELSILGNALRNFDSFGKNIPVPEPPDKTILFEKITSLQESLNTGIYHNFKRNG